MVRSAKILLGAFVLTFASWQTMAGERGPTVVELFTSQGCSSCPPADAFLGELAARDDILALSFHVDYWDYIGWKDLYASPAHIQRQRDHIRSLGLRYVYTPQMVIHGAAQATGSDRASVLEKITGSETQPQINVRIQPGVSGSIDIFIPSFSPKSKADVWFVVFDKEHADTITRGENKGATLRNYNVVRKLIRIGTWTGEALKIQVSPPKMDEKAGCAVIVQSVATGKILGASSMDMDGQS